jgi:hypothetical protein
VAPGGSTTLHWRTNALEVCTAFGAWSGAKSSGLGQSEAVSMGGPTSTFELRCESSDGLVSREASVTVSTVDAGSAPPGGFPLARYGLSRNASRFVPLDVPEPSPVLAAVAALSTLLGIRRGQRARRH